MKIGKSSTPPVTESYTDNFYHDQLDYGLSVDCAIGTSITCLEEPSYPALDSWAVINCNTLIVKPIKSETVFFPIISQLPSDSVCKYYLAFLLDLKSNLHILPQ